VGAQEVDRCRGACSPTQHYPSLPPRPCTSSLPLPRLSLAQIASLAVRSGNGLLLKGGKEAARSNAALHATIVGALGPLGPDLIHLVTSRDEIAGVQGRVGGLCADARPCEDGTSRAHTCATHAPRTHAPVTHTDLLKLDDVIDLVIPRGGNALVSHIQANTKIPVLGHADGICHVYVDKGEGCGGGQRRWRRGELAAVLVGALAPLLLSCARLFACQLSTRYAEEVRLRFDASSLLPSLTCTNIYM
jgi:hypothetical protein